MKRAQTTIAILRAGALARDFCRRGEPATIEAVFERSLYLRSGQTFVCIGAADIGNGPLTLIADFGGTRRLCDLGLRPGQPAIVSPHRIVLADAMTFTFEHCRPWHAPGWPVAPSLQELAATLATLAGRAASEAPVEGLARLVFGPDQARFAPTLLHRVARLRIAEFEAWLSRAATQGTADAPLSEGLVGLGPGLTPSGDDFLLGALALLDALAQRSAYAALAHAIAQIPPGATSPLSHCFLRAAAAGHIGEHFHRIVSSLVAGDLDTATATARRIGHCSGWDLLAGAASALRIAVGERRHPAAPRRDQPHANAAITASALVTTETFCSA